MKKIKILQLAKKYEGNRPLRNAMILGLNPEKYAAKVCYLSGKPDGKNILDESGLSIYLDIDDLAKNKTLTSRVIRDLLRREMPDILHCHRHSAIVHGVISGLTCPVKIIGHVHGLHRTRSLRRRLTNWFILKRVEKIITVSESVRHDVIETNWNIPPEKVMTVKNCIDLKLIDEITINKSDARLKLGIAGDEVIFGTVGRLVPTKGQSYLIDAFSDVHRKIPNSKLVIVGDGQLFKELRKKVARLELLPFVQFAGFRNDVLELIRAFDVFVLPSLAEGLSIALLEAMASRLPVIASHVGGIPEVFGECRFGELVPPKDVPALALALLKIGLMVPDEREKLGDNGRKRIEEEFTSDVMIRKLQEIYDSCMKN